MEEEKKVESKIDKEMLMLSRENNLKNLKKELTSITKLLTYQKEIFKLSTRQQEIGMKSWAIAKENFFVSNPNWKYEEVPEYMELVKEAKDNDMRLNEIQNAQKLETLEKQIESQEVQLKDLSADIERIEKELKQNE